MDTSTSYVASDYWLQCPVREINLPRSVHQDHSVDETSHLDRSERSVMRRPRTVRRSNREESTTQNGAQRDKKTMQT